MRIRCRSGFRQQPRGAKRGRYRATRPGAYRRPRTLTGPNLRPADMGAMPSEIAIGNGLGSKSRLGTPGDADCPRHLLATPAPASDHYSMSAAPTSDSISDTALRASGVAVIETEARALSTLVERVDDRFAAACRLMLSCRGRVVVTGMGKSGHVAPKIAATLASAGTPAFFVHPGEASHGDLGMITAADMVVAPLQFGRDRRNSHHPSDHQAPRPPPRDPDRQRQFTPCERGGRAHRRQRRAGSLSPGPRPHREHHGCPRDGRRARHRPARGAWLQRRGLRPARIPEAGWDAGCYSISAT